MCGRVFLCARKRPTSEHPKRGGVENWQDEEMQIVVVTTNIKALTKKLSRQRRIDHERNEQKTGTTELPVNS